MTAARPAAHAHGDQSPVDDPMTLAADTLEIERAARREAEAARAAAERVARRAERLLQLTSSLSRALTREDIAAVVLDEAMPAFDAIAAWIVHERARGTAFDVLAMRGVRPELIEPLAERGRTTHSLSAEVVRTGEPRFVAVGSPDEWRTAYPDSVEFVARHGFGSMAVLPLSYAGATHGALSFGLASTELAEEERAAMLAFAAQCAQALERASLAAERARLHDAQASAARRAQFLADASRALAIPLDADEVLRSLAALPVPAFADYTIVYRVGADGLTHRVARTHVEPEGERVLDALEREFPLAADSDTPASRVLRTRETLHLPDMSQAQLRAAKTPGRYVDLVAQLDPCSGIVVPLLARGRALGAIVLAMASRDSGGSGRHFDREDVALAESLAERAALALDSLQVLGDAERARAEAEHANRAKSDFLAVMSHELRTPLNAIAGHAQLIDMALHGPVTPAQRDALARIGRAQERLLGLINDILNYARLEAGRVEYDVRPTLVADVVTEVAGLLEPQLAERALSLDVVLPERSGQPPLLVRADQEKLAQVLLNLLGNAVKFTPAGGRIAIELAPHPTDDALAELRVVDSGVGIPSDRLQAIFEPFVQLGRVLSSGVQGTGLGLAISRDLVRGMGGELSALSTLGKGSTFTIVLRRA